MNDIETRAKILQFVETVIPWLHTEVTEARKHGEDVLLDTIAAESWLRFFEMLRDSVKVPHA